MLLYPGTLMIRWTAPLFGAAWIATVQLTLNCLELAAAGFVAGRLNRPAPVLAVLVFAATLAIPDFGDARLLDVPWNIPWLMRLTRDALSDRRFLDSWLTTAGMHLLLFGSLIAGGTLSRPVEPPVSLAVRE